MNEEQSPLVVSCFAITVATLTINEPTPKKEEQKERKNLESKLYDKCISYQK